MFKFNSVNFSKESKFFKKIGLPILGSQLVMYAMTTTDYIMAGLYSSNDLAGVGLGASIFSPLYFLTAGVMFGVAPIIAQHYGAKEFDKILSVVSYGIVRAVIITTISVLLFFVLASNILPIFSTNLLVIDIGVTYLKIIILAYPAVGISVICSRVCQALGQGIPLLITTITRVILLTAPMSYYFYLIGKPIEWVWYSQVFAILIAAVISYFWMRFYFAKFNIVRSQLKS